VEKPIEKDKRNDTMEKIIRCTSCVLPNTLPSVILDKDGVCNYCKDYNKLFGNIETVMNERKEKLNNMVKQVKKWRRPYDCLITLSGGKDSTYALYVCAKLYNMKCLCVTFDNGFMNELAKTNIRNAVEVAGADHLFYTINRGLLLKLYRLFLLKAGDFCSVCSRGINLCSKIVSKEYGIPLIVVGDGERTNYLSFIPEVFQGGQYTFFKNVLNGIDLEVEAYSMLAETNKWDKHKLIRLTNRLLQKYLHNDSLQIYTTPAVRIFDYFAPSREEFLEILRTKMDWKQPKDELEHMDCKLHNIACYIRELKFPELTHSTFYHSHLIRMGMMNREEALQLEIENLCNKGIPSELDFFLKEIGLKMKDFHTSVKDWEKINKFRDHNNRNRIISMFERIKRV